MTLSMKPFLAAIALAQLIALPNAFANERKFCDFFLGRRPWPSLTFEDVWFNKAHRHVARNPAWRPEASEYDPGRTTADELANDSKFWYVPGNVAFTRMNREFPQFVAERLRRCAALGHMFPNPNDLLQVRNGSAARRKRSSAAPRVATASRQDTKRATKRDEDEDTSDVDLSWISQSLGRSRSERTEPFRPGGGTSGGAGATGEWEAPVTAATNRADRVVIPGVIGVGAALSNDAEIINEPEIADETELADKTEVIDEPEIAAEAEVTYESESATEDSSDDDDDDSSSDDDDDDSDSSSDSE